MSSCSKVIVARLFSFRTAVGWLKISVCPKRETPSDVVVLLVNVQAELNFGMLVLEAWVVRANEKSSS